MKGIILAGGSGSRLYPLTTIINKQMIPVYDKPMIYYPFSTLINFGIKDFCIISTAEHLQTYERIFKDGSHLGLNICYKIQKEPKGIAEALIIAEEFVGNDSVSLILGDNIFHGINRVKLPEHGATIVTYEVDDPSAYGVLELDENGTPTSIEEKPVNPKSNLAICGLYFYDNKACEYAKSLKPSKRGELEITDLLRKYQNKKSLSAGFLGRGGAWLDTGSLDDYYKTSAFVSAIENRQGLKIACLEEIAYNKNWISNTHVKAAIKFYGNCNYSKYLSSLILKK